ncbi:hypothetical protein [Mesorhizobium sp. NZP2077]|uniref:hypothetical protein n=1 Tax=Mesorhizobium sp. NZP2077 TaxID=2483404 RepID=UPI00155201E4|nr:hypothetical protein [Mesorhizobium sp. NZP2077]QKC83594.1 hypothetical protein EB232_20110 [Mesorhizobium sp. NZP2077]QKD17115.1 hypothetical protein HGP13_19845 [Mesorhizobium sp. NZP2077]
MRRPAWPDGYLASLVLLAAAGLLLAAIGLFFDPRRALAGWLTVALFLLGLPLGAMTILMVHGLTRGRWGEALRPPLRAIVATLPLALLLLLPVLVPLHFVFPWAGTDPAMSPETVRQKFAYLNVPFFVIRFIVCAMIWMVLGWLILGWTAPDKDRGTASRPYAIGLIVHGLAVTVFAIDWMLSIEPDFISSIYAMLEAAAEAVGAFALALTVLAAGRAIETMPGGEDDTALGEDVANMLFGFMLIWAYLSFMQWLIIWAGDLPEEIHWYILRSQDGWQYLLWLLIALQFAVPFAGFLNRSAKRSHRGLLGLGAFVLAGHFTDVVWRIRPALSAAGAPVSWTDLAAVAGASGAWCALFLWTLSEPKRIAFWHGRQVRG